MTNPRWKTYPSFDALAAAMTDAVSTVISAAVAARGQALVVLPGGTTPVPIFERLAHAVPHWSQVTVLPSDDRLVPRTSPHSNAAILERLFSTKGARLIPLASDDLDYKTAGRAADDRLQSMPWPPDLAWIGMGLDGHAASIFPGPDTDEAITTPHRALGVMPDPLPPEAPLARVTLSRHALVSSKQLLLVISGDGKRRVLEQALEEGAASKLPVGRILAGAPCPVTVYWCP